MLVDPTEERAGERARALLQAKYGKAMTAKSELLDSSFAGLLADRYRQCAAAARNEPLDPTSITYRKCSDPVRAPLGPLIAAERAKIQVGTAYQEAQASEILNSVFVDLRPNPVYAGLFRPGMLGRRPGVVLTHGIYDRDDPLDVMDFIAMTALHTQSARLPTRGTHRVVPNTHHNIEIDAPDAIVDAVGEVLRQLR